VVEEEKVVEMEVVEEENVVVMELVEGVDVKERRSWIRMSRMRRNWIWKRRWRYAS
jgi:hypothetical protein